ncbi:hypothetical protein POVWA2_001490 [Plasmodium ovale wallikeri]|uniref:Uncharacterized protein n=1 Tax=Plasmodium ovale wallikeri TaxID=864142 RepID=A0A1A8YH95_PLAOA|nr:hypothetical protein POVWA1_001600 [Plasmodium ovale wallikeri]SBT30923.1 hypothetical protein POVWA2_001490 [Plasmodium ovale wallikeri]
MRPHCCTYNTAQYLHIHDLCEQNERFYRAYLRKEPVRDNEGGEMLLCAGTDTQKHTLAQKHALTLPLAGTCMPFFLWGYNAAHEARQPPNAKARLLTAEA